MSRLGLRTRLTLWFAATIVIIVTPVLMGVLALQWRAMRAALDHHLEEDLEVAMEMLHWGAGGIEWRSQRDMDLGYDAGSQRWVEVFGTAGELLFVRGLAARSDIRAALAPPAPRANGFQTFNTPSGAYVRSLTTQRQIGTQPVRVRVIRTEDDLRRDLRRLIIFFAIIVPLSIVLAATAGYIISGRMLRPLARMAERARVISADRLSERLPVENPDDELGQLALVFNHTFARLDASFARLKQFTADVSHELRTPLTAIRSVGEVGLREARSPDAYREIIGSMLEDADHLARVVDTLLMLSRWESGRVRPVPARIDLARLAEDVVSQLSVLSEERQIAVSVDIIGDPMIEADPVMTRQAIANVVDNAIKFTREGGRIRVWSVRMPAEHCLVVDDEGPGIPVAERSRVLERFYRVSGSDQASGGTGLGLAIVAWAMSANRGRISIEDGDLGGARVVLAWPAVQP